MLETSLMFNGHLFASVTSRGGKLESIFFMYKINKNLSEVFRQVRKKVKLN
jgi:hypothetical protein